jgi:hypothetical protein
MQVAAHVFDFFNEIVLGGLILDENFSQKKLNYGT